MKNKVSIVVPIYNIQKYLVKCLESLVMQSYVNIEIILIDDGSTDDSKKICEEYCKKDSRIKLLTRDNRGVSYSRNQGIEIANGEYIVFIDGDDWVDVDFIEVLVNNIGNYNIISCAYFFEYVNYSIKMSEERDVIYNCDEALQQIFSEKSFKGFLWNKMFKLSIIKELNLKFSENIKICEDLEFVYKFIEYSKSKIKYISYATYHYRQRKSSAINEKNLNKRLDALNVYMVLFESFENKRILEEFLLSNIYLRKDAIQVNDKNILEICNENYRKYNKLVNNFSKKQKLKFYFIYYFPRIFQYTKKIKYNFEKRILFE